MKKIIALSASVLAFLSVSNTPMTVFSAKQPKANDKITDQVVKTGNGKNLTEATSDIKNKTTSTIDSSTSSSIESTEVKKPEANLNTQQTATTEHMSTPLVQSKETTQIKANTYTSGTCTLTLDAAGTLHISAGTLGNDFIHTLLGDQAELVKTLSFDGPIIPPTNQNQLFSWFPNLTTVQNIENLDTSKATGMEGWFYEDPSLTSLDLSSLNTSNVSVLWNMFSSDKQLQSLDLSSFDTSKVTEFKAMFASDTNLHILKLGKGVTFKGVDNTTIKLPEHNEDDHYLAYWRNVGSGTIERPAGEHRWSSEELINNFNGSQDADTYVWQPRGADITIKYVDEAGNEIHPSVMIDGEALGDPYDATTAEYQLILPDYSLDQEKIPANAAGTFDEETQTVTYVYKKAPVAGQNITVHYQDENGQSIADDVILSGNIGDSYTTEKKDIDGYTFKEVQGKAAGQFTDQAQEVTYIYTKNPVAGQNITVHYQDENGQSVADDVILSGNIGDSYTTEKKDIDGYTFKEVQGKAAGQFTDQAQEVTYIYTKNPVAGQNITVHYQDENGQSVADDVILSGNIGDSYTTEKKDIDGYTFKEVQGKAAGQFTDQAQEVTYIYTKKADKNNNATKDETVNKGDNDKLDKMNGINQKDYIKNVEAAKNSNKMNTAYPNTGEQQQTGLAIFGSFIVVLTSATAFILKRKKNS